MDSYVLIECFQSIDMKFIKTFSNLNDVRKEEEKKQAEKRINNLFNYKVWELTSSIDVKVCVCVSVYCDISLHLWKNADFLNCEFDHTAYYMQSSWPKPIFSY